MWLWPNIRYLDKKLSTTNISFSCITLAVLLISHFPNLNTQLDLWIFVFPRPLRSESETLCKDTIQSALLSLDLPPKPKCQLSNAQLVMPSLLPRTQTTLQT